MAQVFHIRTVNGSTIPVPKTLKIAKYDMDKDSYRTASGLLLRNKIGEKMKFFLEFAPMNKTSLTSLLTTFNSDKFVVTYENILTGSVVSGNFYHGDIEIEPIWIKNEANTDVLYNVFKINLIEY